MADSQKLDLKAVFLRAEPSPSALVDIIMLVQGESAAMKLRSGSRDFNPAYTEPQFNLYDLLMIKQSRRLLYCDSLLHDFSSCKTNSMDRDVL